MGHSKTFCRILSWPYRFKAHISLLIWYSSRKALQSTAWEQASMTELLSKLCHADIKSMARIFVASLTQFLWPLTGQEYHSSESALIRDQIEMIQGFNDASSTPLRGLHLFRVKTPPRITPKLCSTLLPGDVNLRAIFSPRR